jgi:D,D-heptose 1,7-bisphosphate phosphatase
VEPRFLVVYGDTMLNVDLNRFWQFHAAHPGAAASIFLHPNDHPHDSDLVELEDDGTVVQFHPYPHAEGSWYPNLVNAALYVVERSALETWRHAPPPLDFAKNLFPRMLAEGARIVGYVSPEYIKDAGTPERVDKVERDLQRGFVSAASLAQKQTAVFIDRDGTLNVDHGHVASVEQMEPLPGIGLAMRRLNDAGLRTVLVTNQPVIARGDCTAADVRRINARLEWELARSKAYLDRIYYCPHHPDRGFPGEVAALKLDCDCRKPKAGMLVRAQRELNIDLAGSWLIGDSTADAGAASMAGISSIIVETGAAGLDDRYPYVVDFTARDFEDAVRFILDGYPRLKEAACRLMPSPPDRLVFIGGLSRSGKSSVASTLAREWRRAGHKVVVLRVDRWLRSEADRQPGLLGRYETDEVDTIVQTLAQRRDRQISVPFYSRRKRARTSMVQDLPLGADATVIVEGVIALEIARRCGRMNSAIDVRCDEARRRERVIREYELRGWSRQDAEAVYASREQDEHHPLREIGQFASHAINLDTALSFSEAQSTA